ncbi:MAG: TusE/DsrC/DsvC family sulfur relay protein [Myxococcales bacterium]|jgi:tRNA 2-thiouridine synthesizing protein E|nr:TusE/DsrC/DsvC family sulfur relay protein [Myxococcales bacterium]
MDTHSNEALLARIDSLSAQVAYLVERQRKQEELFAEMTPILREVMATATTRLDDLEKKGYFAFGRELVQVGDRIVTGFTPDDVRQLGDAIVGILETVRAVTQPEVLAVASEASEVLQNSDKVEPMGLLGMVRATKNDDVQKGMAVMMDVMRHVGRAAEIVAKRRERSPEDEKRARLAKVIGPRKRAVLGTERPAPRAQVAAAAPPVRPGAGDLGPPAGCAVPAKPAPVAAVIDGVAFTADGHLADATVWSEDLALRIAAAQGVVMAEAQWTVVRFARADFEQTGVSPNIRRITQGTQLATKDLYALFPKAPARTVAKIAGIPKPAGCI